MPSVERIEAKLLCESRSASDMMRYQRVSSPDVLPLGNGKKHSLRTSKEDDADEAGRIANHSPSEAKSSRLRSASWSVNPSPTRDHHLPHISLDSTQAQSDAGPLLTSGSLFPSTSAGPATAEIHHNIDGVGHGGGGDVLLRWGNKKRSRGPRTEGRAAAAAAMPPPCGPCSKVGYLRPSTPVRAATASIANSWGVEEQRKRFPQDPPAKANLDAESGAAAAATEKPRLDHFMWPRIYVSLSRKEKEDDFLAMKGTKLPQRPKKRAKNIDRTLQYCFPGMWLSDLTRGRYEVREKMRVRKKRRGLKGMETDSE
ncbi:hypothetical protein OPV22_019139 [Ensete ventricosum]|uniref:DUF1639 domain-containing protein n=1 Tax=Ensete ventricosum TaxID=4639 RepID=A0AAV8QRZ5_ENSVE|nr:hypothetical protein OPV22_019139 [Ensete ventricosum]